MFSRIVVILLAATLSSATALAAENRPPPRASSGGMFQGTPDEQVACRSDATRYCVEQLSDTFAVLACLQAHREKLKRACAAVLDAHGQ